MCVPLITQLWSKREGWDPMNGFNHTSWEAVITPTDRPKLDCNRCVIEVFYGLLCCQS